MEGQFSRTEQLLGKAAMERLGRARVAVFGIGGVGGYTVEALARSGIGALDLVDNDRVAPSNLNRQIIATQSTIGEFKVDAAEKRVHDINPACRVRTYRTFFLPETKDQFDFGAYDYVVDAIDTVSGKKQILLCAGEAGVPVISAMGAGNKLDPTRFRVADIYDTAVCPLARVMRGICRKNGIGHLKVVYSEEPPLVPGNAADGGERDKAPETAAGIRRSVPGSVAFVPSVVGLIIAGEVIQDLTGRGKKE